MWGNNSCSSNIAGVKALEMFALQFCCLYEISPSLGHMFYKHALSRFTLRVDKRSIYLNVKKIYIKGIFYIKGNKNLKIYPYCKKINIKGDFYI